MNTCRYKRANKWVGRYSLTMLSYLSVFAVVVVVVAAGEGSGDMSFLTTAVTECGSELGMEADDLMSSLGDNHEAMGCMFVKTECIAEKGLDYDRLQQVTGTTMTEEKKAIMKTCVGDLTYKSPYDALGAAVKGCQSQLE